jgi:hypothetical protein
VWHSRDHDQAHHAVDAGHHDLRLGAARSGGGRLPYLVPSESVADAGDHDMRAWPVNTAEVESLEQLIARSTREVEACTSEIGLHLASRYFIGQAAQLIGALRLWAESRSQSDNTIAEMLKNLDIPALRDAAYRLREMATADAKAASWTIELNTNRTLRELFTIAVIAVAALE